MRVIFATEAWADYAAWQRTEPALAGKITALIEDVRRTPHSGLGKPEPLKGDLSGWWSRRITGEHRLVYRVKGARGADQFIEIAKCRAHY